MAIRRARVDVLVLLAVLCAGSVHAGAIRGELWLSRRAAEAARAVRDAAPAPRSASRETRSAAAQP